MADKDKKYLTEKDLKILQETVTQVNRRIRNTSGRAAIHILGHDDQIGPETYLARIPPEGIAGSIIEDCDLEEVELHYADCYVYRVIVEEVPEESGTGTREAHKLDPVEGIFYRVYNVNTNPIPGNKWALIDRDKFGSWYIAELYECSSETGTGSTGTGSTGTGSSGTGQTGTGITGTGSQTGTGTTGTGRTGTGSTGTGDTGTGTSTGTGSGTGGTGTGTSGTGDTGTGGTGSGTGTGTQETGTGSGTGTQETGTGTGGTGTGSTGTGGTGTGTGTQTGTGDAGTGTGSGTGTGTQGTGTGGTGTGGTGTGTGGTGTGTGTGFPIQYWCVSHRDAPESGHFCTYNETGPPLTQEELEAQGYTVYGGPFGADECVNNCGETGTGSTGTGTGTGSTGTGTTGTGGTGTGSQGTGTGGTGTGLTGTGGTGGSGTGVTGTGGTGGCDPVCFTETDIRCEDGNLNQYTRQICMDIVNGCLTKNEGEWAYTKTIGTCVDDPATARWYCMEPPVVDSTSGTGTAPNYSCCVKLTILYSCYPSAVVQYYQFDDLDCADPDWMTGFGTYGLTHEFVGNDVYAWVVKGGVRIAGPLIRVVPIGTGCPSPGAGGFLGVTLQRRQFMLGSSTVGCGAPLL